MSNVGPCFVAVVYTLSWLVNSSTHKCIWNHSTIHVITVCSSYGVIPSIGYFHSL